VTTSAEFRELGVANQATRLAELGARALVRWDVGQPALELIKYRENAVFAVTTEAGECFVLRIHRPRYRTHAHIRSEALWMEELSHAGVATPGFVRTPGGELLVSAEAPGVPEARQCDLLHWVTGAPLGSLEAGVAGSDDFVADTYALIGSLAARVHDHGARWSPPPGFELPPWDCEALVGASPTLGRFWELPGLTPEQERVLQEARRTVRTRIDAFGTTPDRYGLLHGDLLPDNILVDEAGPKLIDFDDCGDGWYVFELATGLFPLLGTPGFEVARDAYLLGYRKVRDLPEEQLELLSTFLMARALSYAGWPAGRPEMDPDGRLAAYVAEATCDFARRYLADAPLGASSRGES
jgi:Ser/Thr protein kinase RdoA (MazF antagonist)